MHLAQELEDAASCEAALGQAAQRLEALLRAAAAGGYG